MCICIACLFFCSPLKLVCFPHHTFVSQHTILTSPFASGQGYTLKKGFISCSLCHRARGHIRNINGKPTAKIISRGVILPRPTERLMHLETEIRCLNIRPQSSKAALNLSGHGCRQFCLIKLGWRQTHPCLQVLFLPMPPWAHQPHAHAHTHAHPPARMLTILKRTGDLMLQAFVPRSNKRFWIK